jgi:hypothetical protein
MSLETSTFLGRFACSANGGGGWTRTNDLRIMSQATDSENKENPAILLAESGKVLQNPQPPRNKKGDE